MEKHLRPIYGPPTKRQKSILGFILTSIRTRQRPPTIREIGEAFEIASPNGVNCHIKALRQRGLIEVTHNASRGIRVTAAGLACLNRDVFVFS